MGDNLFLILAHGLCRAKLGFAGDGQAHTPRLDALAGESVWLENAAPAVPCREAVLQALVPGALTETLKKSGYDVGFFGCWEKAPKSADVSAWKPQTLAALDSMEASARGRRPFAVLLGFDGPGENPHRIPPENAALYGDVWLRQQPNFDAGRHGKNGILHASAFSGSADKRNGRMQNVYAAAAALDDCVGLVTDRIAELGLERETVLCFASDTGTLFGEHGAWGDGSFYGEVSNATVLLRESLRLRPGICGYVTSPRDFAPTVLELLGLGRPSLPGESLVPRLQDAGGGYLCQSAPDGAWTAVRSDRYTLVRRGGETKLFDRRCDPYELNDLSGDPAYREIVATLLSQANA